MEPRKGLGRARQAGGSSAHERRVVAYTARRGPAPYAAGEDITAGAPREKLTPSVTRRATVRGARARRSSAKSAVATPRPLVGADEALTPDERRRARWRRPDPRAAALASVARVARAGARGATRQVRRVSPKRAIRSAAPLAVLFALLFWLFASSYWQTRVVRIEGTSDSTLLALVRAQRLTGCNAFRCDFSVARRAIGASPLVQRVSVAVVFPETTLVRITPRQTAALWRTQGQTWAIGADGVVIGSLQRDPALASKSAALVDDPSGVAFAARALHPGDRMDAAMVAMASQLRSSASGAGLDPASLAYSSADGFTMRASVSGALVVFGSPADAQATLADLTNTSPTPTVSGAAQVTAAQVGQGAKAQVEVAAAMLAQLAKSGASASLIDVRWGSHPYYR